MKKPICAALVLGLTTVAAQASAQTMELVPITNVPPPTTDFFPELQYPSFVCIHADKRSCSAADLGNPYYKQIVILSAGFTDAERGAFFSDLSTIVDQMTGPAAGNAWSVQKKDQLLFVGIFTGGGPLGSATSTFGAAVMVHPIRGYGLALKQDDVYAGIDAMRTDHPDLKPFAAGVLMNTSDTVKTSTAPPSFIGKPYGVSRFTRQHVGSGSYVLTHELAHAGLNFVDEYTESGFENRSIRDLDALSPLVHLDGSWGTWTSPISNFFGVYSIQLSEILANNGNDNVTTSRFPATVSTPGYIRPDYAYEGGLFFGRGTWHMPGANLMNDNTVTRGPDDGFAYTHSPAQQRVIDLAFGNASRVRPNDRLMNAGPVSGWPLAFGSTTHVMLRDADMYHHFQPTQSYTIQVGWYERHWRTCWAAFIPYPCYDSVWTTAQKTIGRAERGVDLEMSSAYGLISTAQQVLCEMGIRDINTSTAAIDLCDVDLSSITDASVPTVRLRAPYRDVDVPASQWMTTYYWRFSTNNGQIQSGFTGWSSFFRSL